MMHFHSWLLPVLLLPLRLHPAHLRHLPKEIAVATDYWIRGVSEIVTVVTENEVVLPSISVFAERSLFEVVQDIARGWGGRMKSVVRSESSLGQM